MPHARVSVNSPRIRVDCARTNNPHTSPRSSEQLRPPRGDGRCNRASRTETPSACTRAPPYPRASRLRTPSNLPTSLIRGPSHAERLQASRLAATSLVDRRYTRRRRSGTVRRRACRCGFQAQEWTFTGTNAPSESLKVCPALYFGCPGRQGSRG
ncbi:hypothetical protein DAEQUDRAFT_35700 [Daedalea quercina L-15889]|uniref:Uncharacterized protein n=1 Tax=Daedalea quercina L-15889 TaxID=1314783 RepID=A0A165SSV8_9APHY|nr:hypothetical protein DAEQUDRAFT_35700 [Daedalea quercina L-15889]